MTRAVWQSDHRPGCPGGPVVAEVEGPYRSVVCRGCGLAIEVSFPELDPDPDAPVPEALGRWLEAQTQRSHPH